MEHPEMVGRTYGRVSLPGIATLLAAVFTALRLAHKISWSWWWVLSPLWAMVGIVVLIFAGIVVTAAIDIHVSRKNRERRLSARRLRHPFVLGH
jgi:uncharacterized membrane protein YhaH (DUF805 family)